MGVRGSRGRVISVAWSRHQSHHQSRRQSRRQSSVQIVGTARRRAALFASLDESSQIDENLPKIALLGQVRLNHAP